MTMQVDPDALRAWSKWLDGLSDDIEALVDGVTAPVGVSDPFPGVDLGKAVFATRDQVKGALTFFAARPREMADIAKGVGDKYELTDDEFATELRAMGGLQ